MHARCVGSRWTNQLETRGGGGGRRWGSRPWCPRWRRWKMEASLSICPRPPPTHHCLGRCSGWLFRLECGLWPRARVNERHFQCLPESVVDGRIDPPDSVVPAESVGPIVDSAVGAGATVAASLSHHTEGADVCCAKAHLPEWRRSRRWSLIAVPSGPTTANASSPRLRPMAPASPRAATLRSMHQSCYCAQVLGSPL